MDLVIQMTCMATWIGEVKKLVLSSHQSCQDCGKFSRCKFDEFEAFEVETNDKIIAVEIKLYNLTIPLLDLYLAWWPTFQICGAWAVWKALPLMPVFLPEEDDLLCLGDASQASKPKDCASILPSDKADEEELFPTAKLVHPDDLKTKLINFPGRSVAQESGLICLDNLDLLKTNKQTSIVLYTKKLCQAPCNSDR